MLHTAGFPHAPLGAADWWTREGRVKRFGKWRLNWEPGTRYEYHATSAHWVLGRDHRPRHRQRLPRRVERRVTGPIGLPRVLGIPEDAQDNVATLVAVGELATPDELEATFGIRELPVTEVTEDSAARLQRPEGEGTRRAGRRRRDARLPTSRCSTRRCCTTRGGVWKPDVLADVTTNVRNRLPDPLSNTPANRSLGLILAGDDGRSHIRGMGRTVSPGTFGHNGAGGQLAWADPATGLSFGYCTNGLDANAVREPRRGTALSSLAAVCATP